MLGKLALRDQIVAWLDRAIDLQDGVLRSYLPKAEGDSSGEGAAAALETQYLAAASGSGAAVGGAAALPGIGTGLAVGLSMAESVAFLDATALFALASAEASGYRLTDLSRRRALLLLLLLGDDAIALVPTTSGAVTVGWGRRLIELDDDAVAEINLTAEKWLLTRFSPRQGLYMLGRLAPFGIGAAIGAAGNAMTAKGIIARLRAAFPPPADASPAADIEADVTADVEASTAAAGATDPEATPKPEVTTEPKITAEPPVEPPTGKYSGLHAFLTSLDGDEASLPIERIGTTVTGGLPAAARRNPAWWSNEPGPRAPQTNAWLAAGFHVSQVRLDDDLVTLHRGPAPTNAEQ